MKHVAFTSPALAARPLTPIRITYELLAPIKVLRKELGLTPNDIAVLTALISFLPRDKSPDLTIVFPSNEALSERANGLDERTIRRSISRLVSAGLIARKTSANRKRFPLRFGGIIRDAYGFDLQPLALMQGTLLHQAEKVQASHANLRSLRSQALALRSAACQLPNLRPDEMSQLTAARNILRRATLTTESTLEVIAQLEKIMDERQDTCTSPPCPEVASVWETEELPVTDGQSVRQTESQKKENLEEENKRGATALPSMTQDTATMNWTDFHQVASLFPAEPRSKTDLLSIFNSIGRMLNLPGTWISRNLAVCSPGKLLLAFNVVLARASSVNRPAAYLERLITS